MAEPTMPRAPEPEWAKVCERSGGDVVPKKGQPLSPPEFNFTGQHYHDVAYNAITFDSNQSEQFKRQCFYNVREEFNKTLTRLMHLPPGSKIAATENAARDPNGSPLHGNIFFVDPNNPNKRWIEGNLSLLTEDPNKAEFQFDDEQRNQRNIVFSPFRLTEISDPAQQRSTFDLTLRSFTIKNAPENPITQPIMAVLGYHPYQEVLAAIRREEGAYVLTIGNEDRHTKTRSHFLYANVIGSISEYKVKNVIDTPQAFVVIVDKPIAGQPSGTMKFSLPKNSK